MQLRLEYYYVSTLSKLRFCMVHQSCYPDEYHLLLFSPMENIFVYKVGCRWLYNS